MNSNINKTESQQKKNKKPKVIQFIPNSNDYIKLATDKLNSDDLFGALVMLRRALELDDDNQEAGLMIAEILAEMQCYEDAMRVIAQNLDSDNKLYLSLLCTLAYCYIGMREAQAAFDTITMILSMSTEDMDDEDIADLYEALEFCEFNIASEAKINKDDAVHPIRNASEVEIERYRAKSKQLVQESDFKAAINLLEPAVKKYPNEYQLRISLILAYYCEHKYEKGIECIKEISGGNKGSLQTICMAALLYHGAGDDEAANRYCEELMKLNLSNIDDLCKAYTVMFELERFEDALKYAKRAYMELPYDKYIINNYAHVAYICGDVKLARSLYDRILKINPNDPVARYYFKLCSGPKPKNLKAAIQADYILPPTEVIKNINHSVKLNNINSVEQLAAALSNCEEFFNCINWAVDEKDPSHLVPYLLVLGSVNNRMAKGILRYILLDPKKPDSLKELILNILARQEKFGTHIVYNNGRLVTATLRYNDKVADYSGLPASYRRLIAKVKSDLSEGTDGLATIGTEFAYEFAKNCCEHYTFLSNDQIEALAVVIEYEALITGSDNGIDQFEFAKSRGISERRYKNARERFDMYAIIDTEEEDNDDDE